MQGVPYGYCHCGCGERTPLSDRTRTARGCVKGEPIRFIHGHNCRRTPHEYVVDENGCWVWQFGKSPKGYGQTTRNGCYWAAHRLYYTQAKGPIPASLQLDHLCRNPSCVNPDHLEPVTHTENCRRGRNAKLTLAGAFMVRLCYLSTTLYHREIAEMFGVSRPAVGRVMRGEIWKVDPGR